ncbi:MAG: GntG family PLP-dependent aldolase [Acidimicrobiia bacterium]|jgi:threonine aldolase
MSVVDLRSDTVTVPTPEMRAAMAAAEVGDDAYGEDPTVNRLESLAAALLGTDAALFVPSGTMANQLALAVLASPGTEVGCAARAHVLRHESGGAAANWGIQLRPFADERGVIDAAAIDAAAADQRHHLPPFVALTIENTAMAASGRPWRADELAAVVDATRRHGLGLHVDGARIWNASVATGRAPGELAAGADTVMFCLSKGLGAPVGSVLCGRADLVARARDLRHRLGGAMRQAGVLAAAGIVALETMVERLADDHARARHLADALADRFPGSVDPATVETNIVCTSAAALPGGAPEAFLARLAAEGVHAGTIDARTVRFVTHKDVDDAGLARAVAALDAVAHHSPPPTGVGA